MNQIKHCPFCNGGELRISLDSNVGTYWIECKGCGTYGPIARAAYECIELWNKRGEK